MNLVINEGRNGRCEYLSSVSNFYVDPYDRVTLVFQGYGYQSVYDVSRVAYGNGYDGVNLIEFTFRVFNHLCQHAASGSSSTVDLSSLVEHVYNEFSAKSNVVSD